MYLCLHYEYNIGIIRLVATFDFIPTLRLTSEEPASPLTMP